MLVAHKIELYVTMKQQEYLLGACGASRYAYNQLVEMTINSDKIPSKSLMIDKIKELRNNLDWTHQYSTRILRNTVDDIQNAIKRKFTLNGGMPKFKKRGVNDSFSIREKEKIKVVDRKFRFEKLPKNLKSLKLRQKPRFNGTIKQATVSRKANKWFVSFLIDTDDIKEQEPRPNDVVGVDLGIKTLATLSDGTTFENGRSLQQSLKKLRRLNKKLSRQQRASNNRAKTKVKLSKLHYYIAEKRKAILHNLTKYLIDNYQTIAIEDLNVSGMLKNHKLAQSISDVSFYEFRRQLEYKAKWYGNKIVVIDRFYPSSKTCSNCGYIFKDLKLSDRIYNCSACGFSIDRDLNSSINIEKVATRSSDTINDCGEVSISSSVKQ